MRQADLLEPVDIPSRLDQLDLYLGQVCAVAGISKMQLDYWTTKAGIETRGRKQRTYDMHSVELVMLISREGTVIRTAVDGISRMGRSTQGVRLMNLRGDDTVSSIARVTETTAPAVVTGDVEDSPGD